MSKTGKEKNASAAFSPLSSKRPSYGTAPKAAAKNPVIAISPSFNQMSPSWRIGRMQITNPAACGSGWESVNQAQLHEIRAKLSNFEAKSWNEILVKDKHWNHTVATANLRSSAQECLRRARLDDLDELVSLRLMGAQRLWGFRIAAVFHILWWDPEHKIYGNE